MSGDEAGKEAGVECHAREAGPFSMISARQWLF